MRDSLFFFNDTATTEIYTLSLHDALPICAGQSLQQFDRCARRRDGQAPLVLPAASRRRLGRGSQPGAHPRAHALEPRRRSEEHTSELQSQSNLVCRLLLEKKKRKTSTKAP